MSTMEPRHLNVLRRMAKLGPGWHYADQISFHGDGRTASAVLVALHRAGLVTHSYCKRPKGSSATWSLTAAGEEAAR